MEINKHSFYDRDGRAKFILSNFSSYFRKASKILDVGCDNNLLKKKLGNKVVGVDIGGKPDYKVNLEKDKLSRFKDARFDFIVCTEVLEHLDNLYEMVDELMRVSSKYVLISLPNCYDPFSIFNIVFTRRSAKFYGLRNEKPVDRHKWFFPWEDADRFFVNYCSVNKYKIEKSFLVTHFKPKWIRSLMRFFKLNWMTQSYWVLIRKA